MTFLFTLYIFCTLLPQIRGKVWHLSFWDWLISLSIVIFSCIHFVAKDFILFFFAEEYSIAYMYACMHTHTHYIFFIHSLVDGHLGCFHILTTVNWAAINMGIQITLSYADFICLGKFPRVGWLGYMADLLSDLCGISRLSSTSVIMIPIPTNSGWGYLPPHTLQICYFLVKFFS